MAVSVTIRLALCILGLVSGTEGHGRMTEPPSRASMWRFQFDNPANYNDNQLFCGGYHTQWDIYGGKCGVCGDSFAGPREHEAPTGKYANGIIVRKYKVGQTILVRIHLTANHNGWFEFRLCQNDDKKKNVTQDCFDKHLLSDAKGTSRFEIQTRGPEYPTYNLVLPPGLRCADCVLQWKYNAGNSWRDGCMGCGPQEQFYACADIAIGHDAVETGKQSEEPFVIPSGDVDERTAWEEEAKEEREKMEGGNCQCNCPQTASAGSWNNELPFAVMVIILAIQMLIM